MEMQADFTGIDEVLKAISALPGLVGQEVYGAGMLAAAKTVATEARSTAAFSDRTGALRGSIRARSRSSRVHTSRGLRKIPGSAAQVVAGGEGANQAFIIEHGRAPGPGYPGMPARPYLEPALVSTTSQQLSVAGAAMQRKFGALTVKITSGKATRRTLRLAAEDT